MLGFKTATEVRQKKCLTLEQKIVSVNENNKISSVYPCSSAVLGNIGSITGLKESKKESTTISDNKGKGTKS